MTQNNKYANLTYDQLCTEIRRRGLIVDFEARKATATPDEAAADLRSILIGNDDLAVRYPEAVAQARNESGRADDDLH